MRTLLLVLAALSYCACQSDEDPRERWEAARPRSYVVELCSGYRGFPNECVRTVVSNGTPLDAAGLPTTGSSPLEALFDDAAECENRYAYDVDYGYVRSVVRDCGSEAYETQVDCFVSGSTELDACSPGRDSR